MVRYLVGLLALWATLTASLARAEPADIAAASRSVVRVVLIADADGEPSLVGHGSGFAVAPDVILTNAHVVDPAREGDDIRIGIVPSQGETGWFARIIAIAPKSDLALVKLTARGLLPPATLFAGPVGDGADVFAVGYPGNVDLAQGLNVGEIVSPTSPVKTRGSVSAGRSSKSFETILHTAAIGSGNSGGPLLDPCGRVIGANSFGTVSGDGDSEFYFAVSTREILRFLRASDVSPRSTGIACRSLAELDQSEAERLADEKVHSQEEARAIAVNQRAASEKAERIALLEVLAERENGLALAGLALLLALGAGGVAYVFVDRKRQRDAKIAGVAAGLLVAGALIVWFLRPGLWEVEARAREWAATGGVSASKLKSSAKGRNGDLLCTLDMPRSRVTVSNASDIEVAWRDNGCANGKEQFGLDAQGWSRVTSPDAEDSVTVARFDPATGIYQAERYFLDLDSLSKLRAKQEKLPAARCGGGKEAARKLGELQAGLKAMLPESPNERLVYDCRAASGG